MLILICGLPGTGKSSLARAYTAAYGAIHLNSDRVRWELGLMGHYRAADKQKVYDALLDRTREALLSGKEVVVDSTFYKAELREPFLNIASECRSPLRLVKLVASERSIIERVGRPRPDSEADFQVYLTIKGEFEPITDPHLVLRSDVMTIEKMVEVVRQYANAVQNE